MFGFLGKLLAKPVLGSLFGGVDKILGRFIGNKDDELDAETRSLISAQRQFQAEFQRPSNWFDSLINGLNRLPRPLMALSALGMLYTPFFFPEVFFLAMQSMELVPEFLWYIIGGIFTFYFGTRGLEKHNSTKVNKEAVKEFMKAKTELDNKKKPAPRKRTPRKKASPEWKNPDLIE